MTRGADRALLLALVASVAVAAWTGREPAAGVAMRFACVAALVVGSGLAAWAAHRTAWPVQWVLGAAVAMRLVAFPMEPTLSDDGYRYLWDGGLALAGVSPYAHAPDAPELDPVRAEPRMALWGDRLNSPRYHTVYPPISQAVFAAAATAPGAQAPWYVLKGLLVLAELVGVVALSRVLAASHLAWYALSPVAAIEIAGQGHTEGLLVGALGVLWWSVSRRRRGGLGLAVVVAGWAKLYPFALGALVLRRLRPAWWLVLALLAIAVGWPLWVGDGLANLFESARLYGGTLDFYSAPYLALKAALYPILAQVAGPTAATALRGVWIFVVALAWWRDDGGLDGARRLTLAAVAGYALLSPMVHPWNLLGALALVPLMRRQWPVVWLVGVAPLTYLRYVGLDGAYVGVTWIGWGGALVLWIVSRYRTASQTASGVALAASTRG